MQSSSIVGMKSSCRIRSKRLGKVFVISGTGTMTKKVFIALLWIAVSTCLAHVSSSSVQSAAQAPSGQSLLLAASRTNRPDILHRFKRYGGGWNVTNKHYLASVAFTGAPAFIPALAWLVAFLAGLILHWCGWRPTIGEEGSDLAQRACLGLIVIFICLAVTGGVLLSVEQEEFRGEGTETLKFLQNQSSFAVESLKNTTVYLSLTKTITVAQFLLPQELKDSIDELNEELKSKGDFIEQFTRKYSRTVIIVFKAWRGLLSGIVALLFVLSLACLVLSWRGKRYAILIVVGWLFVTITFLLLGGSVVLDSTIADTCLAIEEWVDDPRAETIMNSMLPCVDQGTTEKTMFQLKESINAVVNVANQFIYQVADRDQTPQAGAYYYNQSGPLPPPLCYPYGVGMEDRPCSSTEVAIADAPLVWKNYTCRVSADRLCISPGRLTQPLYDQMVAATKISKAIQDYGPRVLSLKNCNFVREALRTTTTRHCHSMRYHLRLVTASLALISVGVLLYISLWLLYGNNPLT